MNLPIFILGGSLRMCRKQFENKNKTEVGLLLFRWLRTPLWWSKAKEEEN